MLILGCGGRETTLAVWLQECDIDTGMWRREKT
jgi:hypothetical protein